MRPMTLAELLDRAIGLYRQNFFKFIGIIAIPFIPLTALQMGLSFFTTSSMMSGISRVGGSPVVNPFNSSILLAYFGIFVVAVAQFILVQGVATAALTRAISDNYTGQKTSIVDAYDRIGTSWVNLIVALLFMLLIFIVVFIWMIIPCVGWFTGPGMFFFLSLAVSPLVAPIIVLEKQGAMDAVRRAWDLARSRFWWLMGCVLVLALFGQLIVTGPVLLFNVLLRSVMSLYPAVMEQQVLISSIVQNMVTMFTSLLYLPIKITIMTVVYFDLRARSEGLDLALQVSSAPENETDVVHLPEITTLAQSEPFFTTTDAGRFALLSLAGMALYAILISVVFALTALAMPALR
jgi:hypothetical protein